MALDIKYKVFLDDLRDGGSINMFGAAVKVEKEFDIPQNDAVHILMQWMREFSR